MLTKSIKIYNVQVNAAGTLLSIFQQGAPVRLPGDSQRPLVHAGATQAAKEPVDRLDGAEDQLQAAGGQQGGKQADVELHNVLRLGALAPLPVVGQVTRVAVFERGHPEENDFAEGPVLQTEHRHNEAVQGAGHAHCRERNG